MQKWNSADTSKCAKKVDGANLKSNVDKLGIEKLVPVSVDLSKLGDVVKNNVIKKDVYNARIKGIEDKISDITKLAFNTIPNAKLNEIKNEMHSITNLTTNTNLNAKTKWVKKKYLILVT